MMLTRSARLSPPCRSIMPGAHGPNSPYARKSKSTTATAHPTVLRTASTINNSPTAPTAVSNPLMKGSE